MTNTTRSGSSWLPIEDEKLKNEYLLQKLPLPQIAMSHKRGVNGIACRLVTLGIVSKKEDIPGYITANLPKFVENKDDVNLQSIVDEISKVQLRLKQDVADLEVLKQKIKNYQSPQEEKLVFTMVDAIDAI